jgi:hemoglobin/transferrin/lactoferrin receptor protein
MLDSIAVALICAAVGLQETDEAKKKRAADPAVPQEVTIFGSSPSKGQALQDAPYSVDVVSSRDIVERRMSRTFPEALEETPGVSVQKTGPGQGSPFIRGFTGFRNVLLIDGIRLNNSVFREGPNQYWATVDAYMLESIEVLRGPASVLYGSDSMGGTVLASTQMPDAKVGPHGFAGGGRAIGRYASAEESYQARQEFWANSDRVGMRVGGTYRDYNDIDGGKRYGRMENSGYDQYSGDAKAVFRVGEKSELVLAAQHDRTHQSPRWHRTLDSRSWHGTAAGTELSDDFEQDRDLYYVQYHGRYTNALVDAVDVSLSFHDQAEKENRKQNPATLQQQVREHEVETPGAFVRFGKQTSAGYLTLGAEVYRDSVESSGRNVSGAGVLTVLPRGNVAEEARYLLAGIYLQDEFSIGALDIVPGLRFSRASVDAEGVDPVVGGSPLVPDEIDDDYQALTAGLRFVFHVDERWNVIAGWGMGFRAPSLDDTTTAAAVGAGSVDFGGPDLDPETSHTFDLGLRADYGRWGGSAFGFYTLLDDFIVRVPIGDVTADGNPDFQRDNAAEGWVYGFEVALFFKATEEVTVFADWGYARGKVDQRDAAGNDLGEQPLGKVGPSLLHAGLRYEPAGARGWIEGLVTAADRQSHLSISDGADPQRIPQKHGTPGYTVYTVRAGYRVTDFLTLTGAVENISNKDYRVHGSGQNETGTNAVLGADLRF